MLTSTHLYPLLTPVIAFNRATCIIGTVDMYNWSGLNCCTIAGPAKPAGGGDS